MPLRVGVSCAGHLSLKDLRELALDLGQVMRTTEKAVDVASDLAEVIEAYAVESEARGSLAPEIVDAFQERSLFQIMVPRELGGLGEELTTFVEVVEEVSRSDASAGWTLMANGATAAIVAAFAEDEAVEQIFMRADSPPIVAGMLAPVGRATGVKDGYILNGNYSYASGSGHATWLASGAMLQRDGNVNSLVFVVPSAEVEFRGNWHVNGLMGTGSFDYEISNISVPQGFTFPRNNPLARRGQASLHLGNVVLGISGHAAVSLGTAKRALEELVTIVDRGRARPDNLPIGQQQLFRHEFALLDAKYRSARGYLMEVLQAAIHAVELGDPITPQHEQRIIQACVYATNLSHEVVSGAYRHAGGAGIRIPHPLGRCLRDMNVQTQHILVAANAIADTAPELYESYRR